MMIEKGLEEKPRDYREKCLLDILDVCSPDEIIYCNS